MKNIKLLLISSVLWIIYHLYLDVQRYTSQWDFYENQPTILILSNLLITAPISIFIFSFFLLKNPNETIFSPSAEWVPKFKPVILFVVISSLIGIIFEIYKIKLQLSYNTPIEYSFSSLIGLINPISLFLFSYLLYKNADSQGENDKEIFLERIKKSLIFLIISSWIWLLKLIYFMVLYKRNYDISDLDPYFNFIVILAPISLILFAKNLLISLRASCIETDEKKYKKSPSKLAFIITTAYFIFAIIGALLFSQNYSDVHGLEIFYLAVPIYAIAIGSLVQFGEAGIVIGSIAAYFIFYFIFLLIIKAIRSFQNRVNKNNDCNEL